MEFLTCSCSVELFGLSHACARANFGDTVELQPILSHDFADSDVLVKDMKQYTSKSRKQMCKLKTFSHAMIFIGLANVL